MPIFSQKEIVRFENGQIGYLELLIMNGILRSSIPFSILFIIINFVTIKLCNKPSNWPMWHLFFSILGSSILVEAVWCYACFRKQRKS